MKVLLSVAMLVAFALPTICENSVVAQEYSTKERELKRELEELEERELEREQMELHEERMEAWIEDNAEEFEQWAEKYAQSWEEWGEQFGQKMERWAEENEHKWESWADEYSQRWEEWAERMEAGEFGDEEMGILFERNLEMLKEMPLDTLIEGALHEGLGELKNAPFESLGELHELIGGALEQSLSKMEEELVEREIAGATQAQLKQQLRDLKTGDLQATLAKLQDAIAAKQKKHKHDGSDRLAELKALLEKSDLSSETQADIVTLLNRELAEVQDYEKQLAVKRAKEARVRGTQLHKLQLAKKAQAKDRALAKAAEARRVAEHLRAQEQDMHKAQKDFASSRRSLERHYAELKQRKDELVDKESEIEAMRREIKKLRKEVERMKKKQQKDKD